MSAKLTKPMEMKQINDFVFVILWKDFQFANLYEYKQFLYV
jgi:hypothetical protein